MTFKNILNGIHQDSQSDYNVHTYTCARCIVEPFIRQSYTRQTLIMMSQQQRHLLLETRDARNE